MDAISPPSPLSSPALYHTSLHGTIITDRPAQADIKLSLAFHFVLVRVQYFHDHKKGVQVSSLYTKRFCVPFFPIHVFFDCLVHSGIYNVSSSSTPVLFHNRPDKSLKKKPFRSRLLPSHKQNRQIRLAFGRSLGEIMLLLNAV